MIHKHHIQRFTQPLSPYLRIISKCLPYELDHPYHRQPL